MLRAVLPKLFVLGLVLATTQVADATPTPVDVEAPLTVEVALVRASRGDGGVDPTLGSFARDLGALPFSRFERVAGTSWSTRPGAPGQGDVGDVHVEVVVKDASPDGFTATVSVTQAGRPIARTSVSRPWGRAHVVTVGPDGPATLLVPVRVSR